MKLLRNLGLLSLAAALALVPACGGGSGKPKVAFVTNNPEQFWTIAEAGCRKAEGEFGVEVVFRKPASGDIAKQTEIIDNLVNQGVKAMAVSVIDPQRQADHLDEVAGKVTLLTQDNDAPQTKRRCYIGTNNYEAGREVGRLVKEVLPDGGLIDVFVGQTEPLNARQRHRGLFDELAGNPPPKDITAVTVAEDGKDYGKWRLRKTHTDQNKGGRTGCTENASVALGLKEVKDNAAKGRVCFVGLWAYNPPAILTAVTDAKQLGKVKIVAFDEDLDTLQGIADGHIHATVVQNPFEFGYRAVKIMAGLVKGEQVDLPADGILFVPHRVVTKDGGKDRLPVAQFREDLLKLLGKK
jgi:ribose transport system substrate-binding protein